MADHAFKPERSVLYVVGTPIGNLSDLTVRARDVLSQVDWIAAEDTRNSRKLLASIGASTNLISCHEHTSPEKVTALVRKLKAGESGAYISDAGTPGVSDPGAALVRAAREAEIQVVPIPGASALTALLSVSGMEAERATFHGFFPRLEKERKVFLAGAASVGGVHVFFESPQRLEDCLTAIAKVFPAEKIVLGREMTKKFEEITEGNADELSARYRGRVVKGECALALLLPAPAAAAGVRLTEAEARECLLELRELGASQRILVALGKRLGISRKEAYSLGLSSAE